jgi:hypothetical protein
MRRCAYLAAGLAITLAGLAWASPGQDAKISASTFQVVFANEGDGDAECPQGQVATGGGFLSTAVPPGSIINVSGPVDQTGLTSRTKTGDMARGWYASAYSRSPDDNVDKVFAICSPSTSARVQVGSFKVPFGKTARGSVSCPRGQRALGGGLGVGDGPAQAVYEASSGPLDENGKVTTTGTGDVARGWYAAAYNGTNATRTFKVIAICARASDATIVADEVNVDPITAVEVAAPCPPGKRALGGGVSVLGTPSTELEINLNGPQDATGQTATTDSGDVPVSWDGAVYNSSDRVRFYKTFAICATR